MASSCKSGDIINSPSTSSTVTSTVELTTTDKARIHILNAGTKLQGS